MRVMTQIEHVVMVMLENRSLDNVLGWLYESGPPRVNIPARKGEPTYDGLTPGKHTLPLKPHFWSDVTEYPIKRGVGGDGFTVPSFDPSEDFPNVLDQLFGDATTTVEAQPDFGTPARMKGFLQNFNSDLEIWDATLQATETYTPADLPILHALARQYAVSDRFHSSMPTQTNPNRAFSVCGTSLGRLVNAGPLQIGIEQFTTPTLFDALATENVTMGIFYHKVWHDEQCFTQYTFPTVSSIPGELLSVTQIDDPAAGFYALARAGKLPAFSYIEPKWGGGFNTDVMIQGNDYHPPTDVRPGENLLRDIYLALTYSQAAWEKTLLIITFDEHGGNYDHVPPPWGATNPENPASRAQKAFDFGLYGVRVPLLLVSPFVQESTVFRAPEQGNPYDHTSTIATLLKWQGINPDSAGLLHRVAAAQTWEEVIQPAIVNKAIPLTAHEIEARPPTEAQALLEPLPAGVARHIAERSRTTEDVKRLVADYHASTARKAAT